MKNNSFSFPSKIFILDEVISKCIEVLNFNKLLLVSVYNVHLPSRNMMSLWIFSGTNKDFELFTMTDRYCSESNELKILFGPLPRDDFYKHYRIILNELDIMNIAYEESATADD